MGYSDVAQMFGKKCTYFYGSGLIDFHVGNQMYKINLSHKMRGRSWFHALHGNIRGWMQTHADVVVTAHGHEWAYMTDCRGVDAKGMSKDRHLLQIGTYKGQGDTYSDRNFKPGVIHNDCLVLSSNEHKIIHFGTVNDAAKWLEIQNSKQKKK